MCICLYGEKNILIVMTTAKFMLAVMQHFIRTKQKL